MFLQQAYKYVPSGGSHELGFAANPQASTLHSGFQFLTHSQKPNRQAKSKALLRESRNDIPHNQTFETFAAMQSTTDKSSRSPPFAIQHSCGVLIRLDTQKHNILPNNIDRDIRREGTSEVFQQPIYNKQWEWIGYKPSGRSTFLDHF